MANDPAKIGKCDHCDGAAVVAVNGRRGCVEHLDDTFRPIGQQVRLIADMAHRHTRHYVYPTDLEDREAEHE